MTVVDSKLVTGSRLSTVWAKDQHVYFAARFSSPIASSAIDTVGGDSRTVGVLQFKEKQIMVKVGISSVSAENALANLDASLPGWDFEGTAQAASEAWDEALSKINIESSDIDQKKLFYTSLYHIMVAQ